MTDFLFSLNAVLPLFAVMLLGFVLRQCGFFNEDFVAAGTKLCFHVVLPCLLFLNIMESDLAQTFDAPLLFLCAGGIVIFTVLLRLIVPRFIKDVYTYSAFIQGCFRSNYVLLGLPFIYNLSGQAGVSKASTVLAAMIPVFNILAVLVLAENQGQGHSWQILFKRIAANPLVIAAALGVAGSLLPIELPVLFARSLSYVSDMAMPLALITIGGSINVRVGRAKLRLALGAVLLKLVALPLVAVLVAVLLGFDPVQMAVILALFAGPPAVSCFPMAFQMGADAELTSLIVVLGTTLAALTMFSFVYALRVMGLV